jgi:hypothetical protein
LLYMSESDEPFEVLHWSGCPSPLRAPDILEQAARGSGTPITEQSLEEFFRDLVQEQDWHGEEERADVRRYRRLLGLFRQHLPGARVFRVGAVRLDIYLVGHLEGDHCIGLRTVAVET